MAIQDGSSYKFVSALNSSLVLDVRYGETTNGTNVQLWTSNNSKAQQWTFFPSPAMH
ncbi:RICIN domain-containing protein [Bifidobacterium adolescentis]|uniref:RICIN domain-containing protein n=1 Tax=Bifidobacterium adolescentis TaxID=1680 RepID=UPI00406406E2